MIHKGMFMSPRCLSMKYSIICSKLRHVLLSTLPPNFHGRYIENLWEGFAEELTLLRVCEAWVHTYIFNEGLGDVLLKGWQVLSTCAGGKKRTGLQLPFTFMCFEGGGGGESGLGVQNA